MSCFCSAQEDILLSNYDTQKVLNNLPGAITDEWIDSIVAAKDGAEQAAIVIIKKATQQKAINYYLEQAPKEIIKEMIRVGYQIYQLAGQEAISEVVAKFEKLTAKEGVDYFLNRLKETKAKVAFGDMDFFYETIDKVKIPSKLQYILIFQPITDTTGRLAIKIYSAKALIPPLPKGDPWSMAVNYTWFYGSGFDSQGNIPPFIAQITGNMTRERIGYWQKESIHQYDFSGNPQITIVFPSNVSIFDFPKQSMLTNVINDLKDKYKNVAKILGADIVETPQIKTIVKEESGNQQDPLLQKLQELEGKYASASSDYKASQTEISRLRTQINNLYQQVKGQVTNNTNQQQTEDTGLEISTSSETEQVNQELEGRLLISEVCSGMDSSKNEFVEIFNPNDYPIDINSDNFSLWIVDSKDKPTQKKITWIRNKIPANGYFLLAGADLFFSGLKFDADAYFSSQIVSVGGVIISRKNGEDFDKVGWGKPTAPAPESGIEGEAKILENGLESGTSLTRKMLGKGLIDTDNNKEDFDFSNFPNPKNSLGQESTYYPKSQYNFPTANTGSSGGSSIIQNSPSPILKVIISEIKNKGDSSSDDFIELFNTTNTDVNLDGWQLKKRTSGGTESSIIVFDEGNIVKSKKYFVWASTKDSYDQEIGANASTSSYLADNNSIALFDKEKRIIDALAWQESINPFIEGIYFASTHQADQSIGRKLNSSSYIDADNNATDFELQTPTPKNDNQTYQGQTQNNPLPNDPEEDEDQTQPLCQAQDLLISEVKLSQSEYVEIYNPLSQNAILDNCFLVYFSSTDNWNSPSRTWQFENGLQIPPNNHFLVGIFGVSGDSIAFDWQVKNSSGNNYSIQQLGQNGAAGLFKCQPTENCKIDLVGWDNTLVKEGTATKASTEGKSMSRIISPDNIGNIGYQDTDDNDQDFEIQNPTPKSFSHHNFTDLDNDGLLDIADINVNLSFNTSFEIGEYIFKNLTISNNAQITAKGDCVNNLGVKIKAKNITIESGASISADGQGCEANNGDGAGNIGSGGGYGGRGGGDNSIDTDSIYGQGGEVYGDFILPADIGSGGGSLYGKTGTSGGGVIILEAEEKITIDGNLSASAINTSNQTGAGSGGSIYLTADEIKGAGFVKANGGNSSGGAGGGGRIAIYYNLLSLPFENIQAFGGKGSDRFEGAAGTIFIKNKSKTKGDLLIKNRNLISLTETEFQEPFSIDSLDIVQGSRISFATNNFSANSFNLDGKSIMRLEDDFSIDVNSILLKGESLLSNISDKITVMQANNISIREKAKIESNVNIIAASLLIDPDSVLSADIKGLDSNNGDGTGNYGSGGGYGGRGGGDEEDSDVSVYGVKGTTYGNFRAPQDLGSGGGSYSSAGGRGGGLINLNVDNLIVNGNMSTNGTGGMPVSYGGYMGGGGSGGSVYIKTKNLSGTGIIMANGGTTNTCGGGGGRIALYYDDKSSFGGVFKAYGGSGSGGSPAFIGEPGTIYFQQNGAAEGELKFGEF